MKVPHTTFPNGPPADSTSVKKIPTKYGNEMVVTTTVRYKRVLLMGNPRFRKTEAVNIRYAGSVLKNILEENEEFTRKYRIMDFYYVRNNVDLFVINNSQFHLINNLNYDDVKFLVKHKSFENIYTINIAEKNYRLDFEILLFESEKINANKLRGVNLEKNLPLRVFKYSCKLQKLRDIFMRDTKILPRQRKFLSSLKLLSTLKFLEFTLLDQEEEQVHLIKLKGFMKGNKIFFSLFGIPEFKQEVEVRYSKHVSSLEMKYAFNEAKMLNKKYGCKLNVNETDFVGNFKKKFGVDLT